MTPNILQIIGACLSMVVGLYGLFRPVQMGKAVGLKHSNLVGLIELRVFFGSFLVALPAYALWQNNAELYIFFGVSKTDQVQALIQIHIHTHTYVHVARER